VSDRRDNKKTPEERPKETAMKIPGIDRSSPFHLKNVVNFFCYVSPLFLWVFSENVFGGVFSVAEQRMIVVLLFAIVFWILEPIPVFATSVSVIFILLAILSDTALTPFLDRGQENFGKLVPYKDLFHSFASPVIMLFLGGFFLSGASSKYGLDKNLARVFLRPFGSKVETVMLGAMLVTAFFSLWMANTPVTAMMLAICAPIIGLFSAGDPGRAAFLLSIPMASTIGGIGTPVGTPANAVAMKYLTGETAVSFLQWMTVGVPYVIVMVLVAWWIIKNLLPAQLSEVKIDLSGSFDTSAKAHIVYFVFPTTLLLWLTSHWHGLNIYTVSLFPVCAFVVTGVINKNDLKKMGWDVLWLISGGIALGIALEGTGLTTTLVHLIPFHSFPPAVLIISATVLTAGIATIMSHTATANLLVPIVAAVGAQSALLVEYGGSRILIASVVAASSLGMALPISTPCNALAYAVGGVSNQQMMKVGLTLSVLGVTLLLGIMLLLGKA
jgi:solute carrier family 13 (sodium-dependent dicarboxylate transporter), member 2/3/5